MKIKEGMVPCSHGVHLKSDEPLPMLRELRKNLLLSISGGERRIGSDSEIKEWMRKQYAASPIAADIFRSLLYIKADLLLASKDLPSLDESMLALSKLEKRPLPESCFASVCIEGESHGVLMQRDALRDGGLVYAVTMFDRQHLCDKASHIEIRASQKEPEPVASVFTESGWKAIPKQEIEQSMHVSYALRCLAAYHRYKYPTLRPDQVVVNKRSMPKPNPYLEGLIASTYKGEITCTKARVPIDLIEPRDFDYALNIPNEEIQRFMQSEGGVEPLAVELLLYEHDGKLVMDDDYLAYLSYKALQVSLVPAVIIGKSLQERIEVISTGFGELIPPILVSRVDGDRQVNVLDKRGILEKKLSPIAKMITPAAKLEAKFVAFCRLLSRRSTRERELHHFLLQNPEIIDCHLASIFSEVRIGRYKADLVLQYQQLDKRIVLIELERHNGQIFTKTNRLREKVTHACQQVEDWIEQIRVNAPNIPTWLDRSYTPEGAVVIGRSSDLSTEQRDKLFQINSNRLVKIITYDDLLERMSRLMGMLDRQA